MSSKLGWVAVEDLGGTQIGAIGFLGNQAAVIVAFYDDNDADKDGKISAGEWLASKVLDLQGRAVTEVAMQARADPSVMLRDSSFRNLSTNLFTNFATGLVAEGAYITYFSRSVSKASNAIAGTVAHGSVKRFVIRKGLERAVKSVVLPQ